ncbi:RNA polymerase factor sigma-54 [Massilia sp. W12]|uniref:RNA polymerase factor sigma-54 n=1 Tax=Massilia sp. W12 TaxID=3126507 RepID=UPI0030D4E66C
MKQSLQLRTSQHLALTPQLQQSIRLLQLSTLELQQELAQMLSENPMLERTDDPLDHSVRLLADGAISNSPASEAGMPSENPAPEAEAPATAEAGNSEENSFEHDGDGMLQDSLSFEDAPGARSADDEDMRPQLEDASNSLRDHLLEQMRVTARTQRDRALLEFLIDSLDENGYLEESLEALLESLPAELEIELEELQTSLKLLQSFDPPGVGARNLSECLALQIRQLPKAPMVTRRHALQIVEQHLPLLAARDYTRLKKAMDCDDEDLREAQALIRLCQPHPGAAFGASDKDHVAPDVIVKRNRNGWSVSLNPDVMPRLRVNALYASMLKQNKGDGGLSNQLQEAKWLIKNMRQRYETILRVAQAIVERQRNFFAHGAVAMRPLVLREIADTLGLHESTISRVTTQKYMLTPHGMFELKYFFGSHVATEAGGEASSTAIRALIKQLIGAEDPKNPLSDSKLADMLGEQGMVVARRTVAKYREALKIPAVALRKSL